MSGQCPQSPWLNCMVPLSPSLCLLLRAKICGFCQSLEMLESPFLSSAPETAGVLQGRFWRKISESLKSDFPVCGSFIRSKARVLGRRQPLCPAPPPPAFGCISEQQKLACLFSHVSFGPGSHHWKVSQGCHLLFVGRHHYTVGWWSNFFTKTNKCGLVGICAKKKKNVFKNTFVVGQIWLLRSFPRGPPLYISLSLLEVREQFKYVGEVTEQLF